MTSYIGIGITMDLVTNRLEDDGSKYPSTLEKAATWVMGRWND